MNPTLNIRRLAYPADVATYQAVHSWMQQQSDVYGHLHGFDDFEAFVRPDFDVLDFSLEADGELIGFAAWMPRGKGICQFCLVTPPKPRVRLLLQLLWLMQRLFFEQLGYHLFYVHLRPLPQYDKARRLAKWMGWREVNHDHYEVTILDHLSYLSQYEPKQ